MTSATPLAIAYIVKCPESAGRVLASMPPAASAEFVSGIPTPHAVRLIASLQPATAASIVQALNDKAAIAIVRDLDFSTASAIIRQMDRSTRISFLAKIPPRIRAAFEKSLSFPPGTIGAYMTTAIATLTEDDSVATALHNLRRADQDPMDVIFVLNNERQFLGVVSSATVLRHPEATLLSEIMDISCPQVPAFSKVDVVSDPALWQDFTYLPAINREREVIGAFPRKALTQATLVNTAARSGEQSPEKIILAALTTSATGLLKLASTSLLSSAGKEKSNGN